MDKCINDDDEPEDASVEAAKKILHDDAAAMETVVSARAPSDADFEKLLVKMRYNNCKRIVKGALEQIKGKWILAVAAAWIAGLLMPVLYYSKTSQPLMSLDINLDSKRQLERGGVAIPPERGTLSYDVLDYSHGGMIDYTGPHPELLLKTPTSAESQQSASESKEKTNSGGRQKAIQ